MVVGGSQNTWREPTHALGEPAHRNALTGKRTGTFLL